MTRLATLAAASWMALAVSGGARQERTPPLPSFRSSVDVIQIDASVLDGTGHPVRGMRAANFTLFEDGKPQPIVAFSAVDVPERSVSPVAWMRDAPGPHLLRFEVRLGNGGASARRDVRFSVR